VPAAGGALRRSLAGRAGGHYVPANLRQTGPVMDSLNVVLHPLLKVLYYAVDIYIWLLIAMAILSWLVAFDVLNRHSQFVRTVGQFLWRITEPALRPIRRILPNLGGIDISPVILILVLFFVQQVIVELLLRTAT